MQQGNNAHNTWLTQQQATAARHVLRIKGAWQTSKHGTQGNTSRKGVALNLSNKCIKQPMRQHPTNVTLNLIKHYKY